MLESFEDSAREFAEQTGRWFSHSDVVCIVAGTMKHVGHVAETCF